MEYFVFCITEEKIGDSRNREKTETEATGRRKEKSDSFLQIFGGQKTNEHPLFPSILKTSVTSQ